MALKCNKNTSKKVKKSNLKENVNTLSEIYKGTNMKFCSSSMTRIKVLEENKDKSNKLDST